MNNNEYRVVSEEQKVSEILASLTAEQRSVTQVIKKNAHHTDKVIAQVARSKDKIVFNLTSYLIIVDLKQLEIEKAKQASEKISNGMKVIDVNEREALLRKAEENSEKYGSEF